MIEALADVMLFRGVPENIRSDNGPEFVAEELREAAGEAGYRRAVHRARKSLGKRVLRKFQRKLRDECLNGEIFYSLKEAQIVIEKWRVQYNTKRPHSALSYRAPAFPRGLWPPGD